MSNTFPSVKDTSATSLFSFLTKNEDAENQLVFPLVVAPNMQNTFPEVKSITRFKDYGEELIKVNNEVHREQHAIYADSNFFINFSFHLAKGNPQTVLSSAKNIVLSTSVAKKYFGDKDPIGKTIELVTNGSQLYIVSGVAGDAPANSSIQFDLVLPLSLDPGYQENINQGFNQANHLYIIELSDKVSSEDFESKMNQWVKKYYTEPFVAEYGQYYKDYDFKKFHWYLRPVADCHYNISVMGQRYYILKDAGRQLLSHYDYRRLFKKDYGLFNSR